LGGGFTIEQFLAAVPRRWRRRGQRFARGVRRGRGWLASGLILVLAACDTVASLSGRPPLDESVPSPLISANPLPPTPADRGRAVARMPTDSRSEPAPPASVLRGREASNPPRIALPDSTGKSGEVTLNFAGADIRDVVAAILGDTLKLNYVVDPEVMGPVTININRPVPRDELLSTLEAVLNSRGAAMVQNDGIIRVMPLRKEGKPTGVAPLVNGPGPTIGEHNGVFPLRFVSATDMQHLLEKVLPSGQAITADDQRHMLVVQGSPSELKLAEDTVRIFDINQLSGMSMALVPLSHAEPASIADELKNIFTTRKEPDNDAIRFMAISRLNAVMILSRSGNYLDEARAWVARLDRERNPNERRVYVYNLQYAKATQVGQKLQGLLTGIDIQFKGPGGPAGDGLAAPNGMENGDKEAAAKAANGKPPAPIPVAAVPIPVPFPGPAAPPPPDRNAVRIEADEAHNALLISAGARDYELIRQVLEGIDVPPLQVLIEVTVAEVALNDKLNYGVEYFINSGRGNILLTTANSVGIAPSVPGFALSYVTGNFQPRAILDLLSDVTQTKVISTPRLLVLSNQTARLQVGDVVPIITQSATSTVTSTPLVLNNVTYRETGVVLEVTPRVNAGGYVTLDVNQSVSDVVNTTTSNIDSPTIRQRRLTSTISVKSGESILLGGLIQESDNRNNSGIPVLNEIPGIGALFGSRANTTGRTEMIMLMTPRVISNDAESRDVTARISQQFQAALDGRPMAKPRLPTR
jgi:general secretion pathway protein D